MADVNALYPRPPDPSQGALDPAKVLGMLGQVNALQRFQAEFGAKKAIGDAYTGALQPDGTIDQGALAGGLKNPAASYGLPEAMTTSLAQRGQQLNLDTGGQAAVAGLFAGVDAKTATRETIHELTARAARQFPSVPPATINSMARAVLNDPLGLAHGIANMQNLALGPGASAAGPEVINPATRAKETISVGEFNRRSAAGGGAPGPGVAAPGGTGGVQTTLPAGEGAAAEAAGSQSGGALARARDAGLEYRRQVFPLEKAIPALEKLGPGGVGPGSETVNHLWSFAQTMGMPVTERTGNAIKDYDEAKKYLTDWVTQNGSTGTNDKLAAAFSSNANTHISDAASLDVAKAALALRRSQHALLQDFEATGLPESQYSKWASQENAKRDPRVYAFDMLTPAQRNKVLATVPDRKKFLSDVRRAEQLGIMHSGGLNAQ